MRLPLLVRSNSSLRIPTVHFSEYGGIHESICAVIGDLLFFSLCVESEGVAVCIRLVTSIQQLTKRPSSISTFVRRVL
jgi:hypothetical protein